MAYITYDELIQRYPLLKTAYINADDVTSDLIYFAEIEVNGRLGGQFTVPFSPVPGAIKDLTKDIAWHKHLRTKDPKKAQAIWDSIYQRFKDIKSGEEVLYTESGTLQADDTSQEVWSNVGTYVPAFSMLDAESEYTHVDSNRLYDEEVERGRTS